VIVANICIAKGWCFSILCDLHLWLSGFLLCCLVKCSVVLVGGQFLSPRIVETGTITNVKASYTVFDLLPFFSSVQRKGEKDEVILDELGYMYIAGQGSSPNKNLKVKKDWSGRHALASQDLCLSFTLLDTTALVLYQVK
jgi:hypothetical protein